MGERLNARGLIELVLDEGSFTSWDTPVHDPTGDPAYAEQLKRARARSGADEAVLTGAGRLEGHDVAVVVGEFGFLGGSIGRATAGRIVTAVTRATRERLPVLVATSSGGTTASMMPLATRFSASWTPAGNGVPLRASNTRGPRNPTRAPGSATVTCPSDPHDAKTPPVVGWRR